MVQHLCHVCGRRSPKNDRYIFPIRSAGSVTVIGEEPTRYAGNVPPVHLACAKRAARLCPHLSHAYAAPVPYPSEDTKLMPRLDVVEGMEDVAKSLPPGLRVVFSCLRVFGPRFSARVQVMRQAHAAAHP
jgi:ferredoxin